MAINAATRQPSAYYALQTGPASEPVAASDLKLLARIDTATEDALLSSLLIGAREIVERYLGRALITQTWKVALDYMPDGGIVFLPYSPASSVTSVKIYSEDGTSTTVDGSAYFLDTVAAPARLEFRTGVSVNRSLAGLEILYVAGYGASGSSVPQTIRNSILYQALAAYESRVPLAVPTPEVARMLHPYRIVRVG